MGPSILALSRTPRGRAHSRRPDPYNLDFLSNDLKTLPGISAPPAGTANLNLINKPLSESLIFFPLGQPALRFSRESRLTL